VDNKEESAENFFAGSSLGRNVEKHQKDCAKSVALSRNAQQYGTNELLLLLLLLLLQ
jgi:hypothetical protein